MRAPRDSALPDRHQRRFLQLREELQSLKYFCKGTVLVRTMKCGKSTCACHVDPSKRHGPYWEWTYKAQAKTVNIKLRPASGPIYQAAVRQYHQLKSLLTRLERTSRTALAALARQEETAHKKRTRS
jgi:uncharacterized protein DUF6788